MSHAIVALVSLASILVAIAPAHAGPPTETLRVHVDRMLQTLSDPALQGRERVAQRRSVVFEIAGGIFDFDEMARQSLGRQWEALSAPQRAEFVAAFTALLRHGYFSKLEMYDGENVVYTAEAIDGDRATVRSLVVRKDASEIPIEFRMVQRDAGWRLYDIAVDGMSLIGNYRVQFAKVIRTASYDDLVRRLKAKAD